MSVETITLATPPPTVNVLDPAQRTRLLKSTRKLGDVLGATPHLLDFSTLPTRPLTTGAIHKKRNLFFSHSAASSVTSLASTHSDGSAVCPPITRSSLETRSNTPISLVDLSSYGHKRHKSKPTSRPLVLCLQTLSLPPSDTLSKPQSAILPTTSVSSLHDTPLPQAPLPPLANSTKSDVEMQSPTPLPDPDQNSIVPTDVDKLRRKRMAKLTRTLGENIPTELVFPRHHKSPSEPYRTSPRVDKEKRDMSKVSKSNNGSQTPTQNCERKAPPPLPSSPYAAATRPYMQRSRSLTVGGHTTRRPARKPSAFSPSDAPFASITTPTPATDEKQENGWDGEWNVKDAEKRAKALRNLKGR
ncbi:hypothetical protein APHAL10511_006630 [Amanita phalloides]|nr:hypothetical protein APHAL10511_006630 [Amanita phalloides]